MPSKINPLIHRAGRPTARARAQKRTECSCRCGRACSFAVGGSGDEKEIILLLECRTRDEDILAEIHSTVSAAIRLEIGAPVTLILVPRGSMIVTSSGKLSRARVREKFLKDAILDLQADVTLRVIDEHRGVS